MDGPRLPMALMAVLALVATAVLVGGGEGTRVGDPPPDLADALPRPIEIVEEFGAALRDGEPADAAALVADDWTQLELPGLPWRSLGAGPETVDLAAALDFYGQLVDVDMAGCRVRSQTLSTATAEVVCNMEVDSPYATVTGLDDRVVPTTYWIENDEIAGILRSHLGTPMIQSYCFWAERSGGTDLFDTDCALTVGPDHGRLHQALADEYLDAGRPGPGRAYRIARTGISAIGVMVREHNRAGQPALLADDRASAATAPGTLGGAPSLQDFLQWSKVVYELDLGSCFVDGSGAPQMFTVECPRALWSGPLLENLTLDPVSQAASFSVEAATVRSIGGATDPALDAAWQRFCEWAGVSRPESADVVIGPECAPRYGEWQARALLMLMAEYAADPR